jgi:hypothetical protein
MARTLVTATVQNPDQYATNLTTTCTSSVGTTGAGNGILIPNVLGQTVLVIVSSGTTSTLSVNIGATEFGQSATAFSVVLPATAGVYLIGLFHSAMDIPGTNQVAVDFSSVTGLTCGVIQLAGVY